MYIKGENMSDRVIGANILTKKARLSKHVRMSFLNMSDHHT